jgi:hypothetical protein
VLIEVIGPEVKVDRKGTVTIRISVPGFSRYGLPPGN